MLSSEHLALPMVRPHHQFLSASQSLTFFGLPSLVRARVDCHAQIYGAGICPCSSRWCCMSFSNSGYIMSHSASATVTYTICPTQQQPPSAAPPFRKAQGVVTEQGRVWFTINYYRKDSPFLSLEVPSPTPTCEVRNACRQRKDVSQCQRLVKRKGIVYLKDLE